MKAYLYQSYGAPEVLQPTDTIKPIPQKKELLIKVYTSTVTPGVTYVRQGIVPGSRLKTILMRLVFGIRKPKRPILGYEFAGVVEETGSSVTGFKKGDTVYGTTTGLKAGSYAGYVVVPEKWSWGVIAHKPDTLSFEQATALPVGAMTALHILLKAKIKTAHNVLIYGASGSVGTYALQIAQYYGARVTAVCSGGNVPLVMELGADKAIDYTVQNFNELDEQFDIIMDAVGKITRSTALAVLKKGGTFCSVKSITDEKQIYLSQLHEMIAAEQLTPVIDRVYSFHQLREAHRYVDQGHKKGNVVINHLL